MRAGNRPIWKSALRGTPGTCRLGNRRSRRAGEPVRNMPKRSSALHPVKPPERRSPTRQPRSAELPFGVFHSQHQRAGTCSARRGTPGICRLGNRRSTNPANQSETCRIGVRRSSSRRAGGRRSLRLIPAFQVSAFQFLPSTIRAHPRIAAWPPRGFTPCPSAAKTAGLFKTGHFLSQMTQFQALCL